MIKYTLIRSRRRTLALHITPEGELEARAPLSLPVEAIEAFILKKQKWVEKHLTQVKQNKQEPKAYAEGEAFLFMGKEYFLHFSETQKAAVELNDSICVAERHRHRAKKVITDWYRKEAMLFLSSSIEDYELKMGVKAQNVRISNAGQRWGSCSPKGDIRLSWRLIMTPPEIIDYVVVHELAHLKHHNHSKAFWQVVERILPDYKSRRNWLKQKANLLNM